MRPSRRSTGSAPCRRAPWLLALVLAGCGAPRGAIDLPRGPGTPIPGSAAIWAQASAPCRAVRTLEAVVALGGRAGGAPIRRTRIRTAAARPDGLRLEALAPFGAPVFIVAARRGRATLLLPRDRLVVRDAPPADVLGVLAGLALGPADVLALLTGCLVPEPVPAAARRYGGDQVAVVLAGDATAYLRGPEDARVVTAGRRGGLTVAYAEHVRGLPRRLRIQVAGPDGGTDLTAALSRVSLNVPLAPAVFTVEAPPAYRPAALDDLRRASPIAQPPPPGDAARRP